MELLKKWLMAEVLRGKRTRIIAILLIVGLNSAKALGWIDDKTYMSLMSVLTGAGLLTASAHKDL